MATAPAARPQTSTVPRWRRFWVRLFAVLGPGLIVAFADTEAGSITTAASSGAQFGMKLVLLQILLIVPLFIVQEMTVRLGTVTGKGHARLIRENYGVGWCYVSLCTMLVTNVAALVTEFIGIAGAALIFGLNPIVLIVVAATVLIGVTFSGAYKRAERMALGLCLLELLFIPAAFAARPSVASIVRDGLLGAQPLGDRTYLLLVASNIGAVIMPWMIFYQQSATVDKGLRPADLKFARIDTALGAVATQLIMIAVVVTDRRDAVRAAHFGDRRCPRRARAHPADGPLRRGRLRRGFDRCGDARRLRRVARNGVGVRGGLWVAVLAQ